MTPVRNSETDPLVGPFDGVPLLIAAWLIDIAWVSVISGDAAATERARAPLLLLPPVLANGEVIAALLALTQEVDTHELVSAEVAPPTLDGAERSPTHEDPTKKTVLAPLTGTLEIAACCVGGALRERAMVRVRDRPTPLLATVTMADDIEAAATDPSPLLSDNVLSEPHA